MVVSVAEYRKLLNDYKNTDEKIRERIEFIERFCRKIIRSQLKIYAENKRTKK